MQNLPLLLQQEPNRLFSDIYNCDITHPPYYPGRVSQTFFLKPRSGLGLATDFGGTDTLDYYEFGGYNYALVKDSTAIKIKKTDSGTVLYTGTYSSSINHGFFTINSVKGTMVESGTLADGGITGTDQWLEDTTKTWTANAYAGKYVYMYSGVSTSVGVGQIGQIGSNDATKLYITTGWKVQPVDVSYKIFDSYGECLAFIDSTGILVIHNDTQVIQLKNAGTVIDATYNQGRLYILNTSYTILASEEGYFSHYFGSGSVAGSVVGAMRIISFQEFILVLSKTQIDLVKQDSVTISDSVINTFTVLNITRSIGIHSANSFNVYNQSLYVLTSGKKFGALGIGSVGSSSDKFTISFDDQGIYIQQFLDGISNTDKIGIGINPDNIYITHTSGASTNIYIYDTFYRFWHRWNTLLYINNIKMFIKPYFLGLKVYDYDATLTEDYGDNAYTQFIKSILGDSDIFSIKYLNYIKLYISINTLSGTTLDIVSSFGGNKYNYSISLDNVGFLSESTASGLGSNLLGTSTFGAGVESVSQTKSDIVLLKAPLGISGNVYEITLNGKYEFGGIFFAYEQFETHLTELDNIIHYN